MKKLPMILAILASILFINTSLWAADVVQSKQIETAQTDKLSVLFIQAAKSADLTADPNKPGQYILHLKEVNPTMVWFSDRPNRMAGTLNMDHLIKVWQKGHESFAISHPNVGMVYSVFKATTTGGVSADVLTLSNPQYNANDQTLRYLAKPVGHELGIKAGSFKDVFLFIDGMWCPLLVCESGFPK